MRGRLFNQFKPGMAVAAIPLSWYRDVSRWLNGMRIQGGYIERNPDGIVIYPGASSGGTSGAQVRSSFGVYSTTAETDDDDATVTIEHGYVLYMGGGSPSMVASQIFTLSGSGTTYIVLKYSAGGGGELVDLAIPPASADDGTYLYRVLWEVSVGSGGNVILFDRRTDWSIGSPIGAPLT